MKKILITGANSYIGTSFENYINQFEGFQVDVIDMINPKWREKSFKGYDVVFHVAGIAHSDTGKVTEERKQFYYKINTDLTVETAQKAKSDGVSQFIFMSSAIVYGDSAPIGINKVITKDTKTSPANFYGDSKVQAEIGLSKLDDDSFKVVILRPPMIYGNGSKGNYPLLSKFAKKLPFFPNVKNQRSMLYVGNLVEFIRLMIENEERGTFFPQNKEYVSTSEMVKVIGSVHGKKVRLVKGVAWCLKLMSHFTGLVNKAFGNLTYDMSLSEYKQDYRVCSFEDSVELTEKKKSEKPRAMILASVASMIEQFNMNNIQLLLDEGYDVDVVCNCGEGNNISQERVKQLIKTLSEKNVTVYDVPIPRKISDIKGILKSVSTVKKMANAKSYSLMHCHSPIGSVVARKAFKKARKRGTKVVYTAHGFHFYKGAPKLNWLIFYPIEKWFSRHTDVLITINKEDYEFANKRMKSKKVVYIPGIGVDTEKFVINEFHKDKIKKELNIPENDIMILSIGELNKNKNHEVVLKAIAKLNNSKFHYVIAGKGDLDQYLSELSLELGVDLHLLGYRTDIVELLNTADVFAFPSFREGLSVALMEAMAAGLSCVASDIRGNTDLIDSEGGFLCNPSDIDSFAQCIDDLCKNDSIREKMGMHNQKAIKNFDKTKITSMLSDVYF